MDKNSNTESENESLLDLDISADGTIRPFYVRASTRLVLRELVAEDELQTERNDEMSTIRLRLENRD